ncbi:MAG: AraC family transcriptional regulator [Paenibacillus sp.]|nr:AraC family transcriptional regulator [Paenibacillus sp.]
MFDMPDYHIHNHYELYCLLSGRRTYFIEDRLYPVNTGDLVFIPKHVRHRTLAADAQNHSRLVIEFSDQLMDEIMDSTFKDVLLRPFREDIRTLRLSPDDRMSVEQIIYRLIRELREVQVGRSLHVRLLVTELLLHISRLLDRHQAHESAYESELHRRMSPIIAFINENFVRRLTLSLLSETFYLSPHYISRAFKEVTGFSFVEYVTHMRTTEAKRLLRETNHKVTLIAEMVGFDNFTHFGRVFQQFVHLSPSQYRKMSTLNFKIE